MRALLLLLFLSSCTYQVADDHVSALSPKRQKQKLIVLQKKLESAEKQKAKMEELVANLQDEMRETEIAIIRNEVEKCEEKLAKFEKIPHNLFLAERESLHRIIQEGATPASFEAQVVLDQILQLITNLSESDT